MQAHIASTPLLKEAAECTHTCWYMLVHPFLLCILIKLASNDVRERGSMALPANRLLADCAAVLLLYHCCSFPAKRCTAS